MDFSLAGDDKYVAEGSSGEGVDSTGNILIKPVFFWQQHCSLLSGVSVERACPSLLASWNNCCYSKLSPEKYGSMHYPASNVTF